MDIWRCLHLALNERGLVAARANLAQHHIEAAYESGDAQRIEAARGDLLTRYRLARAEQYEIEADIIRYCTEIIDTHQRSATASGAGSESNPYACGNDAAENTPASGEEYTTQPTSSPSSLYMSFATRRSGRGNVWIVDVTATA